jgi:hypothetical protein
MTLTVKEQGATAALAAVVAELHAIKYEAGGALQPQVDKLIGEINGVVAGMSQSEEAEESPITVGPPVVVTVPYASQAGTVLSSTSGTWADPPPASYEYEWQEGGVSLGSGSTYDVRPEDVGLEVVCVVTAVNEHGSTPATSNAVIVAAGAARTKAEQKQDKADAKAAAAAGGY